MSTQGCKRCAGMWKTKKGKVFIHVSAMFEVPRAPYLSVVYSLFVFKLSYSVCRCVCVCVCERERNAKEAFHHLLLAV